LICVSFFIFSATSRNTFFISIKKNPSTSKKMQNFCRAVAHLIFRLPYLTPSVLAFIIVPIAGVFLVTLLSMLHYCSMFYQDGSLAISCNGHAAEDYLNKANINNSFEDIKKVISKLSKNLQQLKNRQHQQYSILSTLNNSISHRKGIACQ